MAKAFWQHGKLEAMSHNAKLRNVFDPAHPGTRVYGRGDAYLRWEDQDDEIDETMPATRLI